MTYRSHRHRNLALPHCLDYYSEHRPHGSIAGLLPISRVHNVLGRES
jgi:hypothetical protein